MELDCPGPGYLVLGDAWAPGWRAEVDGVPALIERANLAVRAVRVPGGEHHVTFRYQPRWRLVGPLASLLGLVLAGGLILAGALPSRRKERRAGP